MAVAFMTLGFAVAGAMPRGGVDDLQEFVLGSTREWVAMGTELYRVGGKRLTREGGIQWRFSIGPAR
jgi:hypothetical protein